MSWILNSCELFTEVKYFSCFFFNGKLGKFLEEYASDLHAELFVRYNTLYVTNSPQKEALDRYSRNFRLICSERALNICGSDLLASGQIRASCRAPPVS